MESKVAISRLHLLLGSMLSLLLVSGCSGEISKGGFKEFKIGMSQDEALQKISSAKKYPLVEPVPEEIVVVTQRNIQELPRLASAEGIAIQGADYYLQVEFNNSLVSDVFKAPEDTSAGNEIGINRTREYVLVRVQQLLEADKRSRAFNILPDSRHVAIQEIANVDANFLKNFDNWQLSTGNNRLTLNLAFVDGKLKKIRYYWVPMELP